MRAVPSVTVVTVVTVVAVAAGLSLGTSGCSLSFKFGKAPRAPANPTTLEACVWKHRIRIRPAWASTQSEYNPDVRVNRARKSRAWTFYQGGRRISAQDALAKLRDTKLSRDYRRIWTAAARRGRHRVLGSSTALAAAVILGIAGGGMLHGIAGPKPSMESDAKAAKARFATAFVFIGVAIVSSVFLPIVMKVGYRDVRAGEAFGTLFISTEHAPAMRMAVARYNKLVRRACRDRFSEAS